MTIQQVQLANTFNEFRLTVNEIANTLNDITGGGAALLNANTIYLTPISTDPTYAEGNIWYDSESKGLNIQTANSDFTITAGEREFVRCRNSSGATILKGSPVYATGVHIAGHPIHGHHPTIELADASDPNKYQVLGLAAHDIPNGDHGYVIVRGWIQYIDTSALTEGTRVHLGASSPGTIVDTAPGYPNYPMDIGLCLTSDAANGSIYVDLQAHTIEGLRVVGDARVSGGLTVAGDLTILGDQTVVSVNNLEVADSIIYLGSGDTITANSTAVSGLNDLTFKGHFQGNTAVTFSVMIDGTSPDTFAWSTDGFSSNVETGVTIVAGTDYALSSGISVRFEANTGHTLNDVWTGAGAPINVDLGFIGNYNAGSLYVHTGLIRDSADGIYKLFDGYIPELEGNFDASDGSFSYAAVQVGDLTAADVTISGNTNISGTLDVSGATVLGNTISDTLGVTSTLNALGAVTLGSTLGVTGAATLSSTLGVTGATTLSSTLAVTGATTLSSTLNTVGNLSVNTNKFTVNATSGDTAIAGTLGVTGAATLSSTLGVTGAVSLSNTLTVSGATILNGSVTLGDAFGDVITTNAAGMTMNNNLNINSGKYYFDQANTRFGINTSTPSVSLHINTTDGIRMPVGTDAERPGSPVTGVFRYNSTSSKPEVYDGVAGAWKPMGGSAGGIGPETFYLASI